MFCYFVCVMPYISGTGVTVWWWGKTPRDRQTDGWCQLIWWNVIDNEFMESNVMMNSEVPTPVLYLMIRWNPSLYSLCGFVTLPRRFRLGIVSGGEVSRSYKAGTAYLLYYRLLDFLFGIFDLFLHMTSVIYLDLCFLNFRAVGMLV